MKLEATTTICMIYYEFYILHYVTAGLVAKELGRGSLGGTL